MSYPSNNYNKNILKIDMHCHSSFSDGISGIYDIEDHCNRQSIGIALCDHNEVRGSLKLIDRSKIPVLPGIEVGTSEGFDILFYFEQPDDLEDFYRKHIEKNLLSRFMVRSKIKTNSILEAAKDYKSFSSIAHPYASGRKSVEYNKHNLEVVHKLLTDIDAIETFNGSISIDKNLKSSVLAKKLNKKVTMGSDAHEANSMGSVNVAVQIEQGFGPSDLFAKITENNFSSVETNFHNRTGRSTLKHIMYFISNGSIGRESG